MNTGWGSIFSSNLRKYVYLLENASSESSRFVIDMELPTICDVITEELSRLNLFFIKLVNSWKITVTVDFGLVTVSLIYIFPIRPVSKFCILLMMLSFSYWQFDFQEDISAIFGKADKDNSGTLTFKEFQEVIDDICERYPQVELYLKKMQMSDITDLLKESTGDVAKESIELNIEEFKSALSRVDSQMKNLPATAQVQYYFS